MSDDQHRWYAIIPDDEIDFTSFSIEEKTQKEKEKKVHSNVSTY